VKSCGSWMPSGRQFHSDSQRDTPGRSLGVQRLVGRSEAACDLDSLVLVQIEDEDGGRSWGRKTWRGVGG
jgi:hypothetical protein